MEGVACTHPGLRLRSVNPPAVSSGTEGVTIARSLMPPDTEDVMPVLETSSLFAQVIQEHLELKERNAQLEPHLPLGRYKSQDPFDNHPLFKTEEQARLEESGEHDVALIGDPPGTAWSGDDTEAHVLPGASDGLWSRSRDFDWGD